MFRIPITQEAFDLMQANSFAAGRFIRAHEPMANGKIMIELDAEVVEVLNRRRIGHESFNETIIRLLRQA